MFQVQWFKIPNCYALNPINDIKTNQNYFIYQNYSNKHVHGALCSNAQKQSFRGVLRKMYFENMRLIHRKTPTPKCDFNEVSLQLYCSHTSVWMFSCKFATYFQSTFSKNTSVWLLLNAGNVWRYIHFLYWQNTEIYVLYTMYFLVLSACCRTLAFYFDVFLWVSNLSF